MFNVRSSSVDATHRVAAALEPLLRAGDVLLLAGDLGAGKTAFVQGLAVAMGITDRVTSPTFTLAHTYQGRLRLHHLDAYRLESPGELIDLDLPELLDDDAVIAIEWGEVALPELPRDFLQIRIHLGSPEDPADVRRLDFEPVGPSWRPRAAAVARALGGRGEGS